jgi:hypothetical protein
MVCHRLAGSPRRYHALLPWLPKRGQSNYSARQCSAKAQNRHQPAWSAYVTRLLNNMQEALRTTGALEKLRLLLYPSRLTAVDTERIQTHREGVKWLGKEERRAAART